VSVASVSASAPARDQDRGPGLRRELRFWEAIALSIAIMAPTAAMALNGTVAAQLIGRAVPLAFIFATAGVVFVSYPDRRDRLPRLHDRPGAMRGGSLRRFVTHRASAVARGSRRSTPGTAERASGGIAHRVRSP
jgi:hypothetical protein